MTKKSTIPDWFESRVTVLLPLRPDQTVSDTITYTYRVAQKAYMKHWLHVPAAYGLARWHGGIVLKFELKGLDY